MDASGLLGLEAGASATIASLDVSAEEHAELDAVGISAGRGVVLLRRAPFGGPLHLRIDTGVEVALDAELAGRIALAAPSS